MPNGNDLLLSTNPKLSAYYGKLYSQYSSQYPYPEFWQLVQNYLISNPDAVNKNTASTINAIIRSTGASASKPTKTSKVITSDSGFTPKQTIQDIESANTLWRNESNAPVVVTPENVTQYWDSLTDEQRKQFTDYFEANPEAASKSGFTPPGYTSEWAKWGYADEATYKSDVALAEKLGIPFNDFVAQRQGLNLPKTDSDRISFADSQAWTQLENNRMGTLRANAEARAAQMYNALAQKPSLETTRGANEWQAMAQKAFEDARAEILGGLQPTDWVQKYLVTSKPNPYKKNPGGTMENVKENIALKREDLKTYRSALDAIQKTIDDPDNPTWRDDSTKIQEQYLKKQIQDTMKDINNMAAGQNATKDVKDVMSLMEKGYVQAMEAAAKYWVNQDSEEFANLTMEQKQALAVAGRNIAGYKPVEVEPSMDIPDWLQPALGAGKTTQVKGIDTSKWAEAVTPSGQWWNRLNPTQQSMWGSYATAQGGSNATTDLYSSMQMQLPKNINFRRTWRT